MTAPCSNQLCIRPAVRQLALRGAALPVWFCDEHEHEFMVQLGRRHYEDNPTEAVEGLRSYERMYGWPLTHLPSVELKP